MRFGPSSRIDAKRFRPTSPVTGCGGGKTLPLFRYCCDLGPVSLVRSQMSTVCYARSSNEVDSIM